MNITVKYFLHKYHYFITGVIIVLVTILSFVFYRNGEDWKILFPIIGGAVSLIYIVEKQQLDEALLFKQLFYDFNARYDKLNEELNKIKDESVLGKEQINFLFDYFNLCGEEYLFYKNGYIYPEVWKSWVNGMKIYYDNQKIKDIWDEELETNSYYGLNLKKEIKNFSKNESW